MILGRKRAVADAAVAVIVPAKDESRFLGDCLKSIADQSFTNFECLVVDDGSTDDTARIAKQFAKSDPRFRVTSNASPKGPSAARNTGMAKTSAPLITFLDGDDFFYPGSIEHRVEALEGSTFEWVAGTYCDWQPTALEQDQTPPDRSAASRQERVGFVHGPECPFIVTAPLVRREVLERVGGFDEQLPAAEDFDLWVRILREGYTFSYVPIIGVAYRQNGAGLVFSESATHAEHSISIIERQYADLSGEVDPPFLAQPLPHYQLEHTRAQRLLRTYALAKASDHGDHVERIERLLSADLGVLERAGLDIDTVLEGGTWRASRGVDGLSNEGLRSRFVDELKASLRSGDGSPAEPASS